MAINCGAAQFMPVTVRCLEALVEGHLIGLRATCNWGFSSHLPVHSNYKWAKSTWSRLAAHLRAQQLCKEALDITRSSFSDLTKLPPGVPVDFVDLT